MVKGEGLRRRCLDGFMPSFFPDKEIVVMVWMSSTALNSEGGCTDTVAEDCCEGADWVTDDWSTDDWSEGVNWVTSGCEMSLFKDNCFASTDSDSSVFFRMPLVDSFTALVGISAVLCSETSSVASLVLSVDAVEANTGDKLMF